MVVVNVSAVVLELRNESIDLSNSRSEADDDDGQVADLDKVFAPELVVERRLWSRVEAPTVAVLVLELLIR